MEKEVWKDIPNYEGLYQVSNLGNIKSFKKSKEVILKNCLNSKGYYIVNLHNNKAKTFQVHQLVAIAFLNHKPCGLKLVVDHINNDCLDNRLDNLQIVTNRQNVSKDIKNKTSKYTGVCWHKTKLKWMCGIRIQNKIKHLGYFTDEHEAHLKYQEALNNM